MLKLKISIGIFIVALLTLGTYSAVNVTANKRERNVKYFALSEPRKIIEKGIEGAFDFKRTHTLSIVELNKGGYKYWGYYHGYDGKNIRNDVGLAYSNDLVNWTKEGEKPIVPNMRWGSCVVDDGIVNLFGTRNYGNDSYLVRLTSKDGKNFSNEQTIVPPVPGEKQQNGFIFYDEKEGVYRFYYYHFKDETYYIEEKHSKNLADLAKATPVKILSDMKFILAAPSMMYKDGKYWLAAETLHEVKGKKVWKTIVFASRFPTKDFYPVDNHEILVNSDACYFQYIFDNKLSGVYSHEYSDGTWEMYLRTHDFENKSKINVQCSKNRIKVGEIAELKVSSDVENRSLITTDLATYACSDNEIVTLKAGKVIGLKHGDVQVTVSYGGVSQKIDITVE